MLRLAVTYQRRIGWQQMARFSITLHPKKQLHNAKKGPSFSDLVKGIGDVKSKENPFYEVFTEEMDTEQRAAALSKLDIKLSEGFSTILSDPDLKVKGSLALGKQLEIYRRLIKKLSKGPQQALLLQNGIDYLMNDEHKETTESARQYGETIKISCTPGCTACCHRLISVTNQEAAILTGELKKIDGGKLSEETLMKLEKQSKFEDHQKLEYQLQSKEKSRCIFLSDKGMCKVYDNRPVACRTHQVLSDPFFCSPKSTRSPGEEPVQFWYPLTEALSSAIIDNDGIKYTTMSKGILEQVYTEADERMETMGDADKLLEKLDHSIETGEIPEVPKLPSR